MSLSAADLAAGRRLALLYEEAERLMAARVRRRLQRGITQIGWNERKLFEVRAMEAELRVMLTQLEAASAAETSSVLRDAYRRAATRVEQALGASPLAGAVQPSQAVLALERSIVRGLQGTHFAILRQNMDVYRRVVSEALELGVSGVETRRNVSNRILASFERQGVVGFKDRLGRPWKLGRYANMAARTGIAQAHLQGTVDRLGAHNVSLGRIPDAPEECELCRPWENRVVSLVGRVEGVEYTLDDAKAAGLFHPNCKHGIVAYIPELERLRVA